VIDLARSSDLVRDQRPHRVADTQTGFEPSPVEVAPLDAEPAKGFLRQVDAPALPVLADVA
jgi:hypothetical protein